MDKKKYRRIVSIPHKIHNAWKLSSPIHLIVNRNSWGGNLNSMAKESLLEDLRKLRKFKTESAKFHLRVSLKRYFDYETIAEPSNASKYDGGLYVNKPPVSEFADNNTIPF